MRYIASRINYSRLRGRLRTIVRDMRDTGELTLDDRRRVLEVYNRRAIVSEYIGSFIHDVNRMSQKISREGKTVGSVYWAFISKVVKSFATLYYYSAVKKKEDYLTNVEEVASNQRAALNGDVNRIRNRFGLEMI